MGYKFAAGDYRWNVIRRDRSLDCRGEFPLQRPSTSARIFHMPFLMHRANASVAHGIYFCLRPLLVVLLVGVIPQVASAWNPMGHHAIGVFAYELLDEADQKEVLRLLSSHPDFNRLFSPPEGMTNRGSIARWHVGTAGNWPDMIRGNDADRPTWHYQLGATMVLGDRARCEVPDDPGPLPGDATLATSELHIGQAYELCRNVLGDSKQSDADRAIALCWIFHLVADGHQPCHAGSLYAEEVFPEGDRGGNFIKIGRANLHGIWDGVLGNMESANKVRKLVRELRGQAGVVNQVIAHRDCFGEQGLDDWIAASLWLDESRVTSRQHTYTQEVLEPIYAAMRGLTEKVESLSLDSRYYENAGRVARIRATQAAYRLAAVMEIELARTAAAKTGSSL